MISESLAFEWSCERLCSEAHVLNWNGSLAKVILIGASGRFVRPFKYE